jgi:hypothetical protein
MWSTSTTPLFLNAEYRTVDMRLFAIEQVPELFVFGGRGASVRLFFKTRNRLFEPAIPFQRGIRVVGVDPPVDPGQVALRARRC